MEGAPPDVEAAMAKDDLLSALHLLHQHIAAAKVRPRSPSAIFVSPSALALPHRRSRIRLYLYPLFCEMNAISGTGHFLPI